jgi:ASC-1-like (ASCH) protein
MNTEQVEVMKAVIEELREGKRSVVVSLADVGVLKVIKRGDKYHITGEVEPVKLREHVPQEGQ